MAARTGKEYLERLASSGATVHIQGETLKGGIQDHPAFRNVVQTYAELYDLQHSDDHRDVLTCTSPTSGERVGTSFLAPTTPDDLVKHRSAFKVWADHSNGMLCRTGDSMNSSLMALASAADWFAEYYFFGDPVRMAGAYVKSYDREPYKTKVQDFLDRV
ncbi:4-hydroxyphenylacetate 3-hydroxylase N-terminal domain-containing protein [Streptomyces sp. NPDC051954]|uniref:4-hydroxyphenylacetate 3-hydroxylase N-terminal domain-containing protein n=1 Tax=Streptomyces sp. NPDC051954 TaxID=3155524 RepID=UPI00343A4956